MPNSPVVNALIPVMSKNIAIQTEAVRMLSTGVKPPSLDPVSTAMGNTLNAQAAVLQASVSNAAQGAATANIALSANQQLIELNTQAQSVCTQAQDGNLLSADRAILQHSLDALMTSSQNIIDASKIGDLPLLGGAEAQQVAFPTSQTNLEIVGLGGTGSFMSGLIVSANSIGKIEGQVLSADVLSEDPNATSIDVALSIGSEEYKGSNLSLSANSKWNLRSAGGSVLTLSVGSAGIADPETAEKDLKTALGLNPGGTPAVFVPGSSATQSPNITLNLSPEASPGIYGVGIASLGAGTLTLSVSNGATGDLISLTGTNGNAGATVQLPNLPGISVTFGSSAPAATPNFLFELKNDLILRFQTGSEANNQTAVSFPKTTLVSLQYSNMDVMTPEAAARTAEKLKQGLGTLNKNASTIAVGQHIFLQ